MLLLGNSILKRMSDKIIYNDKISLCLEAGDNSFWLVPFFTEAC